MFPKHDVMPIPVTTTLRSAVLALRDVLEPTTVTVERTNEEKSNNNNNNDKKGEHDLFVIRMDDLQLLDSILVQCSAVLHGRIYPKHIRRKRSGDV